MSRLHMYLFRTGSGRALYPCKVPGFSYSTSCTRVCSTPRTVFCGEKMKAKTTHLIGSWGEEGSLFRSAWVVVRTSWIFKKLKYCTVMITSLIYVSWIVVAGIIYRLANFAISLGGFTSKWFPQSPKCVPYSVFHPDLKSRFTMKRSLIGSRSGPNCSEHESSDPSGHHQFDT